jgi:RND family efflux transporter MFP subunit
VKYLKLLLVILLLAAAWLGGYGYGRWYGPHDHAADNKKKSDYYCPMHPAVRSDKPGTCPICSMDLVTDSAAAAPPAVAGASEGGVYVSPEKRQLIGVKLGTAEPASMTQTLRAVGTVAADETRMTKVQSRIDGWIDKVFVDFTGKPVEQGQPLLTIYSPELLATQQEFLLALRSRDILRGPSSENVIAAARRRLELFDLSEDQIAAVERSGQPLRTVTLYAPVSGTVMMRNAFPKQRITPDTELYALTDLSRVWIIANLFESDAARLRLGAAAQVRPAYGAGRSFSARVTFINPQIDPQTRTLKLRLEAGNPRGELRPEMFVDLDFFTGQAAAVTVPAEAVLDSGLEQRVFVDRGDGHLEPRRVQTGARLAGRIEITSGLRAGERIVVSGTFLIDSESRLKAAAAGYASGSPSK